MHNYMSKQAEQAAQFLEQQKKAAFVTHFATCCQHIKLVWNDLNVQLLVPKMHIDDSVWYFMNELDRIAGDNYVPTIDDVVHMRSKQIGIEIVEFSNDNLHLQYVNGIFVFCQSNTN